MYELIMHILLVELFDESVRKREIQIARHLYILNSLEVHTVWTLYHRGLIKHEECYIVFTLRFIKKINQYNNMRCRINLAQIQFMLVSTYNNE